MKPEIKKTVVTWVSDKDGIMHYWQNYTVFVQGHKVASFKATINNSNEIIIVPNRSR